MSESNVYYSGGSNSNLQSGFRFIYNGETGTIFTRTPSSWGKICLFYLIYYAGLAGFFAGLLSIFLYGFTDDIMPSLVGCHSILPQNPGMGFRPQPNETKALLKFDPEKPNSYNYYVEHIDQYLSNPREIKEGMKNFSYFAGQDSEYFRNCTVDSPKAKASTKPCTYDLGKMPDVMRECVNQSYGFPSGQPCVAVKLNRIVEFMPKLTNETDPYLKIRCEGQNSADEDNVGSVEYFPKDGVEMWHYPYMGQKHYLSPLVFVKFRNLTRNVLVQVVCRPVNVANIEQKKQSRGDGRIVFELLVGELGYDHLE